MGGSEILHLRNGIGKGKFPKHFQSLGDQQKLFVSTVKNLDSGTVGKTANNLTLKN